MVKKVTTQGSVRIDFLGGTIDLDPICLILKDVITLNCAIDLKAEVCCEETNRDELEIYSYDYQKEYKFKLSEITQDSFYEDGIFSQKKYHEMTFVVAVVSYFKLNQGLKITLKSGSPAGAGLGGSSSMAVTLFKALAQYQSKKFTTQEIIAKVKSIESQILNKGVAGYQDYHPALYGGILALKSGLGEIVVEQLWSQELASHIESNCMLIYSGQSRLSGINNWEVYKNFFDSHTPTINGLSQIAHLSQKAYQAINQKNYDDFLSLIILEGKVRNELFPNIMPDEIAQLLREIEPFKLTTLKNYGVKMCGAGGGGCFLLVGYDKLKVRQLLLNHGMKELRLVIEAPI